ncbi:nuclear pore complex protein NUP1-like isoform X2 [Hibiscus syriacus]|uniref:nuclear pore complex protein NUP1-like isoform X2 n=1 Tax=Hibiscus syriacus TaxID=106335 RepID=UPI001923803B|nr:nuclear pore complex protein NUP1-like isoform X2 [Hibiscus syriacus]
MATAREESNPYDGGFGAGGKFRKRPFRRKTPYDRPPTAISNPNSTVHRNGWLSKLVDPAQRLITSSAHSLFASIFRKRLTPSESSESETNLEARENSPAATSTDPFHVKRADMERENPSNHAQEGGLAELEEILKRKTFTRSEIDHLTTLLHSRTVDFPAGNEEIVSNGRPMVSYDKKEKLPDTPATENGTENHFFSTPIVSSTVLDEDVASPAELAKAYMGSRPQNVFVSMLRLHNQVPKADSALLNNKSFPSKSPIRSFVPRSVHVGSPGDGFATPRSWGRSAIYSMARTPYCRTNSALVPKGAGTASGAFGGPSSSSQSVWEQNRISGSGQGVLKRRSSALENDIGSIDHPIRRIRKKSNILSSKQSSVPASANSLPTHVADSSSSGLDVLAKNGENSTPSTSFTPVPSKSSEVASKILQQLDKLVSPGEKSQSKLSPSMPHGQSLKSLENVDSSKFLENMHGSDKLSASYTVLPDDQDSMSYNRDKAKGKGSTVLVALSDKSGSPVSGLDAGSLMKANNEPNFKAADSTVIKSSLELPQPKRRAFHMSANEDYLDLDDDGYPDGAASATPDKGSKSAAAAAISAEKHSSLSEVKSAFRLKPDLRTSDGSAVVENNADVTFPVPKVDPSFVPAVLLASQSTSTAKEDASLEETKATSILSFGEKVASAKQSDAAATSVFRFATAHVGEISSATGSSGAKLAASSDTKLENSSSFATTAPGTTNYLSDKIDEENAPTGIFSPPKTATSTSGSIFKFDASESSSTLSNGSLASSPFSYPLPTPSLIPGNGQSSSSGSTNYVSITYIDTSTAATASTTANVAVSSTSSSPSIDASVSSFMPVFKFASSGDPSASVSMLSATSREAAEVKTQDTSSGTVGPFGSNCAFTTSASNIFGGLSAVAGTSSTSGCTTAMVIGSQNDRLNDTSSNITNSTSGFFSSTNKGSGILGGTSANTDAGSSIFGSTSSSMASTGSSTFSTTTSITSIGSNIFGFSAPATSGSTTRTLVLNAVNAQAFAAGTGFGTSTQSTPVQFSSSASSPSVGNSTVASGSFVFGSSAASVAKPFGSEATFGMSSSSSETNSLSSGSGIASGTFGSSWQAPNSPIFGSSPSGFSFGSSASVTASSSAPTLFGSSTGASSNSLFSFTSAAFATPSVPVFGNSSPGMLFGSTPAAGATPLQSVFGNSIPGMVFGSTPSRNNDQMEDTMAEDNVVASPAVSIFGQPPYGSPFGASNPAGATFQFGAQPTTPHNPSPFHASSSQELGAGGSFSLGTGGGDKSARRFVKVRKQRKK